MDYQFSVLLYSKYSQLCTELLNDLEVAPVNLQIVARLRPICIDNEKVRNQIYKCTNISIVALPCILLVYGHGGVEKYEGETAFEWADQTIRKFMPKPPIPIPPVSPNYQSRIITDNTTEYIEESEEESPQVQITKKTVVKKIKPVKQPINTKKNKTRDTKTRDNKVYEDVSDSENIQLQELPELSDDEEPPKRPPAPIRTGPNTYEFSEDYNEVENDTVKTSAMTGRVREPASAQSIKNGDLMAAALAMQKEREVVEPNQRGPGMIRGQQGPI